MNDLAKTAEIWGVEAGYHDVFGNWHTADPQTISRLIAGLSRGREGPALLAAQPVEPLRAFQGDGRRDWALAVQLYAIRSARNWGHGDFSDLRRLVAIAAHCGAAGIGLNPLHALFADRADQASPYAPNSRLFLNPLYIDVEAIPEFPGVVAAGLEAELNALRATDIVAYADVARVKLAALRLTYDRFRVASSAQRRAEFEAFRQEQGDALLRFACFEVLRQRHAPAPWPQWPHPWRHPEIGALHDFHRAHRDACEFHEFMQWVAASQLQACRDEARRHGLSIGLYVDVAVGTDPYGADAWSDQDFMLADVSVGAPPDEFNPAGQDWGLATFNPHALPAGDFKAMRRLIAAAMRYAGAIRLDHALWLKRIFMIPRGLSGAEGAYVRFPLEPLLRVVTEESNRHGCIVVGEDLGTVPAGFRETLAQWGLWSYRVMLFEREHDGAFRPPHTYPAESVATFNTHDLPSFRGWLTGHDLRVKGDIGVDPGETSASRGRAQQLLRAVLSEHAAEYSADDIAAVAAFLAATPSRLVTIALDDVLGVLDQVNVPGTTDQHPNWRRRLPVSLEDLDAHDGLRRVSRAFAQAGRGR